MALSLSNIESKNNTIITNENKTSSGDTWASDPLRTWADGGSWAVPGTVIYKETKNNLSITNESKN